MKQFIYSLSILSLLIIFSCQYPKKIILETTMIKPPIAKKVRKEMTVHNDTRIDNYYWLNQREDPEVIDYLNAENAYTDESLKSTEALQKTLFEEIKGRIKQTDESVPYKKNGYYFITRYEEGKEYPIYSRKKETLEAPEEIMLDVNIMAEGHDFYAVGGRSISSDNNLLIYGEDTVSRRIYTLKVKNLETGELLPDIIENTTGSGVWANDNKTFFYTRKDDALRPYQIWKHILGTDVANDEMIFEEKDDTYRTYIYKTKSKKFLIIGSSQTLATEYQILEADNPNGKFRLFEPRDYKNKVEYHIGHFGNKFYILTNWKAPNFRLMETFDTHTNRDSWKEVIAHRSDVLLTDMTIFKDYLVLSERINGNTQLRVIPNKGHQHYIDFGEDAFTAYTSINPEFSTDILRVGYTSMTTPSSVFDYNMKTKKLTLLKEQEVVGDFNKTNYESQRLFVDARDGAKVPISLVYKKGTKLDGSAPLLLYGYGSYGSTMDPYFSSVRLSLLDRGFIYAIAHIRGGEEMGRHWYEDGKLLKKKNTFYDFIDCGDFLVKNNYTNYNNLFGMGGSAGGLLMGAVINMRPEMWKGIVAAVPFVDVVTTMLDESIPLTTGEFDEWGNPKNEEYYHYIKSYSPIDNVGELDYPALLVTTGLHDSQVQYWEPAKWVAKLRDTKKGTNPIYLKTNMETGHGGASGRFERYKEIALEYAFLLELVE